MKKVFLKLLSCFIIIAAIFCGCGEESKKIDISSEKNVAVQKEKESQYENALDPWGQNNYKKIGIINTLEKDLEKNYTTAIFKVNGQDTEDRVKIYGTNMNIQDYENQEVFITGVKDDNKDKDYALVRAYKDVSIIDNKLIGSIEQLNSIDDTNKLNIVKSDIDKLQGQDYKNYVMNLYNNKINELSEKKQQEEQQRQEEDKKQQEQNRKAEEKKKQEAQKSQQQSQKQSRC